MKFLKWFKTQWNTNPLFSTTLALLVMIIRILARKYRWNLPHVT